MKQYTRVATKLFSFSLQTQSTIPTCLHKLAAYPSMGIKGAFWRRLFFTMHLEEVTDETNSFRLTVSSMHFPSYGATANVSLERVADVTLINGHIRNLAWKYLFYISFCLSLPILLLLAAYSLSTGAIVNAAIMGILPLLLLYIGYIRPTLNYREMLIDSIRDRLDCS